MEGRPLRQPWSTHRQTLDFLVLALSLLYLTRTFVVEPMGVPTSSMAPTLLGLHKDVCCERCALTFPVGVVDDEAGRDDGRRVLVYCPNCDQPCRLESLPAVEGDRLLVRKEPLEGYGRFDLFVFRNVDSPRRLFVKRIVGLPGETVRLRRGEIETLDSSTATWKLRRKSPELIRATAILVHDDRRRPNNADEGKSSRWFPDAPTAWRQFVAGFERTDAEETKAAIAYQHRPRADGPVRLITDDLAYNDGLTQTESSNPDLHRAPAGHPVADLLLEASIQLAPATQSVELALNGGSEQFAWRWRRSGATCELTRNGQTLWKGAQRPWEGPCRWTFANVDRQLLVWRDGTLTAAAPYEPEGVDDHKTPSIQDLRPASAAAEGAGTRVSDLVLRRDLYYRRSAFTPDYLRPGGGIREIDEFLSRPSRWDRLQSPDGAPWTLGPDEYLALGDNSARSNDSRHWRRDYRVRAQTVLGKVDLRVWPPPYNRLGRVR